MHGMLHLAQYRSLSAAAAGGAAAFADVAAARGPHLRAAVETQRRVGTAPLLGLYQLGRAVRQRARVGGCIAFWLWVFWLVWLRSFHRYRLGQLLRVDLLG